MTNSDQQDKRPSVTYQNMHDLAVGIIGASGVTLGMSLVLPKVVLVDVLVPACIGAILILTVLMKKSTSTKDRWWWAIVGASSVAYACAIGSLTIEYVTIRGTSICTLGLGILLFLIYHNPHSK